LPEQHRVVAAVGAEGVAEIKEQRNAGIGEPQRQQQHIAELEQLEAVAELKAVAHVDAVERDTRPRRQREQRQDAEREIKERNAVLDELAKDERPPGSDRSHQCAPCSRVISATKRSERVGVVTVPSVASASRSPPS